MTPEEYQSRSLYEQLQPGDRVEVVHGVTVGSSAKWSTTTVGTVLRRERRRHGLHFRRSADDKVYSDVLILSRDDGELTTVTMDEFTRIRKL
jgi:hypothetical protein